jgi:hypothetical protein
MQLTKKRKMRMKKLIVTAIAIAMGFAAHAASYSWGMYGYINNGDGAYGAIDDTTAYLFNAGTLSQADMVAAFYAGTLDLAGSAISSSIATVDGVVTTDPFDYTGASTDWTAYFAVIQNDKLYISDTATAPYSDVGTAPIIFGDQDAASNATFADNSAYAGAGWYAAGAVPEPTSGLLLLIGVAGLALRRKQA